MGDFSRLFGRRGPNCGPRRDRTFSALLFIAAVGFAVLALCKGGGK